MKEQGKITHLMVKGKAGLLETELWHPKGEINYIMIVCHPYPAEGATMHNKVVVTVDKVCRKMGLLTIKFNFRGVGKSEGIFDEKGAKEDLQSIIEWVSTSWPDAKLNLAGFSFGSYVAYSMAYKYKLESLVCIAPPVNHYDFSDAKQGSSWLVIQGTEDEVTPYNEVKKWLTQLSTKPVFIAMHDTSHLFHGMLIELKHHVSKYLHSVLKI